MGLFGSIAHAVASPFEAAAHGVEHAWDATTSAVSDAWDATTHWVGDHWRQIAVIAATVVVGVGLTILLGPAGLGLATVLAAGVGGLAAGATGYALNYWLTPSDERGPWSWSNFAKATVVSGVLAAGTAGVGELVAPGAAAVSDAVVPEAVSSAVPQVVRTAATNAAAGSVFGAGAQVVLNAVNGQPLGDGVGTAAVTGGVTGAVVGPIVENVLPTPTAAADDVALHTPSQTRGIINALDGGEGEAVPSQSGSGTPRPVDVLPDPARGPPIADGETSPARLAANTPTDADGLPSPGIFRRIFGRAPTNAGDPVSTARPILESSPTFQQDLQTLLDQGYTIEYGEPGKGFYCNTATKEIVIDPTAQNPWFQAQVLSHEFGHALEPIQPIYRPGMTRDEYIAANTWESLRNEAIACLKNVEIRDEVLARTGQDIGINGDPANTSTYERIAHDPTLTRDQKLDAIANLWKSGTPSTAPNLDYEQYYAQGFARSWDAWVASQTHPSSPAGAPGAP